jgi:sugar lactone lactonase YvrE
MDVQAEVMFAAAAKLGEGPIWDAAARRLLWVDIMDRAVHVFDPDMRVDRVVRTGEYTGTVVPWSGSVVVAALKERIAAVNLDSGAIRTVASLLGDASGVRFNDGKCDPAGRLWAGTLSLTHEKERGSLYMLDANGRLVPRVDRVTTSNGIAWSRDGRTMYYIDTPTGGVDAFDFDLETGGVCRRRRVVTIPAGEGHPDGMTMDEEGMLWVAHWDGFCVTRHDPATGRLLGRIRLPVPRVTACWFGGAALDTLFVTTASVGLDEAAKRKYPQSGHLFAVVPGVKGVSSVPFHAPVPAGV